MADGPQAKVVISADDSPLRQSLREMVGKMRDFGEESRRSTDGANGPLAALRGHYTSLVSLIGGGVMAAFIKQHVQLQDELSKAAQKAGVSTEAFSGMAYAAKLADVSSEQLGKTYAKLGATLADAQQGQKAAVELFQRLKLDPKNFRDADQFLLALADRFATMGDKVKQTGLVVDIFGEKLGPQLLPFLNQGRAGLEELRKEAERLGVVVSTEAGQAAEKFNDTLTKIRTSATGAGQKLASELVPVLQAVADEFFRIKDGGSGADVVIRGIRIAFETVAVLGANVIFVLKELARTFMAAGQSMAALATLDFKGYFSVFQNLKTESAAARAELDALERRIMGIRDAGGGRGFVNPAAVRPDPFVPGGKTGGKAAVEAPKSYLSYYEGMLAEERRVQSTLDAGREFTKEQELAFWRFLAENLQLTTADRVALLRKMNQLEVEIARDARKQREGIEESDLQAAERLAIGRVAAEQQAARLALDVGQISKAQMAALEVQFEADRFRIQSAGMQERLRLLALDPNSNPLEMARIKNELLVLEQEHQTRRNALLGAAMQQKSSLGGALTESLGGDSAWQTMLDGMLLKAQSWRQALGNIFSQVGTIFVQKLVTEPAAAWIAGLAKMLLVKLGFAAKETATDAATSAAKVGIKSTEMVAVVGANAAEAGAGAAASQASIPYVGPGLALAAMAAVFAAVMALSNTGGKSAAGGYDIPSGVNPMTQLHEEEMVLPSPLANAVRRMAEGGAEQSGGAAGPAFTPEPMPHHAIGDFVLLMRPHFMKMLAGAKRDFAIPR